MTIGNIQIADRSILLLIMDSSGKIGIPDNPHAGACGLVIVNASFRNDSLKSPDALSRHRCR
jgi:hypothetical protein